MSDMKVEVSEEEIEVMAEALCRLPLTKVPPHLTEAYLGLLTRFFGKDGAVIAKIVPSVEK